MAVAYRELMGDACLDRQIALAVLHEHWIEQEYLSRVPRTGGVWRAWLDEPREVKAQKAAYAEAMGAEALSRQLELAKSDPWATHVGVLVEAPPPEPSPTRQPKMTAAFKLLRAELADGERPARDVYAAARAAGVSKRTVDEAKKRLGIEDTRHAFGGPVFWKPPRRVEWDWVPWKDVKRRLKRQAEVEKIWKQTEKRRRHPSSARSARFAQPSSRGS